MDLRLAALRVADPVRAGVPIQLVIGDEPVGVTVGFRLSPEELESIGATADEQWILVSDDGQDDSIPVLTGKGNEIAIRPYPTQEELDSGLIPLGQDLVVWRSKQEMYDESVDDGRLV